MLDYEQMEIDLNQYRNRAETNNRSIPIRLRAVPMRDSCFLFGMEIATYPCWKLSDQLVFKIVDELIYCGLEQMQKEK